MSQSFEEPTDQGITRPAKGSPSSHAQLVLLSGEAAGTILDITDAEISIGRHPDNALVLDSQMVSRQHARLIKGVDQYFVEDLGSRNGVLLNGRKLLSGSRARLHHRDELQLSDQLLLFLACEKPDDAERLATIHLDRSQIRADAEEAMERFMKPPDPDS